MIKRITLSIVFWVALTTGAFGGFAIASAQDVPTLDIPTQEIVTSTPEPVITATPQPTETATPAPIPVPFPTPVPFWDSTTFILIAVTLGLMALVIVSQNNTIRSVIVTKVAEIPAPLYEGGKVTLERLLAELKKVTDSTPSPDDNVDTERITKIVMDLLNEVDAKRAGQLHEVVATAVTKELNNRNVG